MVRNRTLVKVLQTLGMTLVPFVFSTIMIGFIVLVGDTLGFPFEDIRETAVFFGGLMFTLGFVIAGPVLINIWSRY